MSKEICFLFTVKVQSICLQISKRGYARRMASDKFGPATLVILLKNRKNFMQPFSEYPV